MRRLNPGLLALASAAMAFVSMVFAPMVFAYMAVAPARAADMAVPGYYPPKAAYMPPAVYDWTGVYVGGHIGGGWLNDSVTWTTTTVLNAGTETKVQPVGVLGGAQLGANYEFAPWVIGAEASFTSSAITGSTNVPALAAGTQERATSNPQWLVAATGRAGYAANTLLMYVKGGAAWMHAEYTQDTLVPPSGTVFATSKLNATRSGFVVGAGLEYGMTENFSAKAEYDFYDFGTANYTFNVGGVVMPVSIKSDIHVFTVGLNYRWNWSGGWHW